MYLSRVRLNPSRRQTRFLISSAQTMHATVMASHPPDGIDPATSTSGRVLWRLDQRSHDLQLYVVSPVRPDFTGLLEQAGWPSAITWDSTDYEPFLGRLADGQRWRFRLTANPVRSVAGTQDDTDRTRGRVVPHVTVRHQEEWLESRSSDWGFTIPATTQGVQALVVTERHTAQFERATHEGNGAGRPRRDRVSITRASYEGMLLVEDATKLRMALTHGMGRAKAYGCGLMTLAPVQ